MFDGPSPPHLKEALPPEGSQKMNIGRGSGRMRAVAVRLNTTFADSAANNGRSESNRLEQMEWTISS
jgi:hypothetical protein